MGTAIKHPVPDRVKLSIAFLISGHSDAQSWTSECPNVKNYTWRLNPVWHRMLYSCTHMATVGVKGLLIILWSSRWLVDPQCQRRSNVSLCSNTWAVSKHSVGLSRFLAGLCLGRQTSRSRVGLNQLFVVALSHWVDDWNDEIDDHHHYDFLKQPRQPACLLKPTGNCVINDVIKAASIVPTETVSTGRRKWYPLAGANVCGRHTPWLAD